LGMNLPLCSICSKNMMWGTFQNTTNPTLSVG
jgi:hypothetical protein